MKPMISPPRQVMDLYYLNARHELLEVAATLDRLDRGAAVRPAEPTDDLRVTLLHEAISVLAEPSETPNRVERMLEIFGRMRK